MSDTPIIGALAAALAKVQAELPDLERDRTVEVQQKSGGTYSYSYATLANLSKATLPLMAKHGLSFTSLPGTGSDGKMCLRYYLLHSSGECLSGEFPISGEGGIQMIGGRITYARRYCLAALVGVAADEDDDARVDSAARATGSRPVAPPRKRTQPAAPAEEPPLDPEPTPAPAAAEPEPVDIGDAPEAPSPAANRKLYALLKQTGRADKADALRYLSLLLRRTVASTKDLTKDEAKTAIDDLEAQAKGAQEEPALEPDAGDWPAVAQPPLEP